MKHFPFLICVLINTSDDMVRLSSSNFSTACFHVVSGTFSATGGTFISPMITQMELLHKSEKLLNNFRCELKFEVHLHRCRMVA